MRILVLLFFAFTLSSCATLKEMICDCDGSSRSSSVSSAKAGAKGSAKAAAATPATDSVVVDSSDLQIVDSMSVAVDDFVFKKKEEKFIQLCQDSRFDCYVDSKKFPAGKKKIKRSRPPYMTGSKMGLQDNKRVQVRYEFYP